VPVRLLCGGCGRHRTAHGQQRRTISGSKPTLVIGGGPDFGQLKKRGDVDALLALLDDPDYFVVATAGKTLAELNEKRAVEPLLRLVLRLDLRSMDGHQRWEWDMLATALAWLETPGSAGADYLLEIVEGEESWLDPKGGGRPIALDAGRLLAEMGDRRVIDALLRRMQTTAPADTDDTWWEWVEIAEILAALDAVEAVEPLAAALPLAPVYQQEYFATALGDIGDPRAVPALIAALESHHGSYTFITDIIVGTLKDFGTPDALRAIESWEGRTHTAKATPDRASSPAPSSLGCLGGKPSNQ
jgi:hypothetical protein